MAIKGTNQWVQEAAEKYLSPSTPLSPTNYSAFGEKSVAENYPYIQATAVYNLLPANFRSFTSGTGSTDARDGQFVVETGTGVGGYGAIQSFRSLNYQPGQGALARFTALFESNVANSWQGVGLLSIGDELSFGYNGTEFGIWHRYRGKAEVHTLTVTGVAGGAETLTLTLNGVAYSIPLTSGTANHNAYEIASWLNDSANQAVWRADQVDDTVIISAQSDGAKSGSYSFSSSTATGSIALNQTGVTKTSDFVPQSEWNGPSTDWSWFDPSKGNVYQISFQYLGYGAVKFFIEDRESGNFVLVHTIKYPSTATTPNLGNPSLKTGLYCVSLGSTTNLVVKASSFGAFSQGVRAQTRNPRAFSNTQSLSAGSFVNLLALRNRRTYNGQINQVEIQPLAVSVANEGTKNIRVEVRATTNPGVELDFTSAGTNLISDISTTPATITGGRLLAAFTVAGGGEKTLDLKSLQIRMPPTLTLFIQAFKISGSSSDVSCALTWYEDL